MSWGHRYSFVSYHILDLQKVMDGGSWTFEQSLLVYPKLEDREDPHLVTLNKSDIWIQVYDLPKGLISENIFVSIGNSVGSYVKSDPANLNGAWRMYVRIRVTMDVDKPIKRRLKVKREGDEWSWVNFKYERLSMFYFVCGLLGHSERDCNMVYDNLDKEIMRAYGVYLRAPTRNSNTQNLGAKWLRDGNDGGKTWEEKGKEHSQGNTLDGKWTVAARFM